jgi:hypothetical protein
MTKQKEHLVKWHRILLGEASNIVYRLDGVEPTASFYRDLAESLEGLAAMVRRELDERKN